MASDSDDETGFTDCGLASGSESASGASRGRKRQFSMPEMVKKAETVRKAKRRATRGSGSPGGPVPDGAGRTGGGGASAAQPVQLNEATLAAIKHMIDQGNVKLMKSLELKLEGFEKRIAMLEGECMDKDITIKQLSDRLQEQIKANEETQQRLEEIDSNRRLSSLVLSCEDFVSHPRGENIEHLVVKVLNDRIPNLAVTVADVHAAHKLQDDRKVICKFVKRHIRDSVYEARFNLARVWRGDPGRDGRRLPSLYITESLTPRNRLLYDELLRARRPENGAFISSVFSRRGIVWCRTERAGANLRVPDEVALRRILGGKRFPPLPRPALRRAPPGRLAGGPATGRRRGPPAGRLLLLLLVIRGAAACLVCGRWLMPALVRRLLRDRRRRPSPREGRRRCSVEGGELNSRAAPWRRLMNSKFGHGVLPGRVRRWDEDDRILLSRM